MLVQRFARWCETASCAERGAAADIVVRALREPSAMADERQAALLALSVLVDDPSPKVRLALAEGLCEFARAPREALIVLSASSDSIACLIAARSASLVDADFIDLAASGSVRLRTVIAGRPLVSVRLSAALAEIGEACVCTELVANEGAAIAGLTYRRLVERQGDNAALRGALLSRGDLPVCVRQMLILKTGEALSRLPILVNLVGGERAGRLTGEICERSTAELADTIDPCEAPALVEHLRASGQLNVAFLLRTVCAGHVDLLVMALARLSGMPERRVRAAVLDNRRSFCTILQNCGLPSAAQPLFAAAIAVWQDVVSGRSVHHLDDIPRQVVERVASGTRALGSADVADELQSMLQFLHRLSFDQARSSLRQRSLRLAA